MADDPPFYHPGPDSAEVRYLLERRRALGGSLPERRVQIDVPQMTSSNLHGFQKRFQFRGGRLRAFRIRTGFVIPRGDYNFNNYTLSATSDRSRLLSGELAAWGREDTPWGPWRAIPASPMKTSTEFGCSAAPESLARTQPPRSSM